MRNFLFFLFFLGAFYETSAIDFKEIVSGTPLTPLPYNENKTSLPPYPRYALLKEETAKLPIYTYYDLGLMHWNYDPNTDCAIWKKFQKGDFDLIVLDVTVSEWAKKLLTIYRGEELMDFLEVEISWSSYICAKQWRIDSEDIVCVTHLWLLNSYIVDAFSDFEPIKAQHVDTYYQINQEGKFVKLKEVKFKPRVYTRAYLEDKTKEIWDGGEELE